MAHEGIVGDLEKYNKAMEKALVEYHESRMAAVNRIIRDLWRKAYKSGDIDYIFVRADAEGSSRGNYSYRLMMVACGAELEMRGRCSAGQKGLACLIVRLALSEAFCVRVCACMCKCVCTFVCLCVFFLCVRVRA